jgi:hypothetical protein
MTLRASIPTLAILVGVACASTNAASNENAETSSAAIRAAEEVGAKHNPDSALYLQLAKEQFEHARMLAPKDKESADRLLQRAQIDAELSLALARTESEKAEALGTINQAKMLKQAASSQ